LYGEYLTKEVFEWFGDFKKGVKVIHSTRYVDDLVLLAKEIVVVQSMIESLIKKLYDALEWKLM
jgi:hypothetical protein